MSTNVQWRSNLLLNHHRKPKAVLANPMTAFREAPEWVDLLWFDTFHQRTVLHGKAPWAAYKVDQQPWTDHEDARATEWLQHRGIDVSPPVASAAIETVARAHMFHPVLDYLDRCRWDGTPRLDRWAVDYLGAEDTPYVRAVSARWMISAIARVMEPGCKADCALILEGPQGKLKSTALTTLGAPWFTDEVAELGTKDAAMQFAGRWIVELSELEGMTRADTAKVKAFLSRTTDRFRPPYGRRVIELKRQCVCAGTVNEGQYLRDPTGGRRFWPIKCGSIDVEQLGADRDQLWAEALHRYKADEHWWLEGDALVSEAREQQRARYQSDAWEGHIRDWLGSRDNVSVSEVLEGALVLTPDRWGQHEQNRVAHCLVAIGWERRQLRLEDGKRVWRYVKPSPVSPDG